MTIDHVDVLRLQESMSTAKEHITTSLDTVHESPIVDPIPLQQRSEHTKDTPYWS